METEECVSGAPSPPQKTGTGPQKSEVDPNLPARALNITSASESESDFEGGTDSEAPAEDVPAEEVSEMNTWCYGAEPEEKTDKVPRVGRPISSDPKEKLGRVVYQQKSRVLVDSVTSPVGPRQNVIKSYNPMFT